MALKLKCPCGARFTVPESATGKRGKCSKCGRKFIIPASKSVVAPIKPSEMNETGDVELGLPRHGNELPDLNTGSGELLNEASKRATSVHMNARRPAASPPEIVAEAGRRSPPGNYDVGPLTNVRKGVNLVYYGLCCIVVGIVTTAIIIAFSVRRPSAWSWALVLFLIILGVALGMIGRIMCLSIRKEVKVSWVIYAAVACDIGVILDIVRIVSGGNPNILLLLTPWCGLFLFVIFLKGLSAYARNSVSAKRANTILTLFLGVLIVAAVSVLIIMLLPDGPAAVYLGAFLVAALVLQLPIVIIYMMLLVSMRQSLSAAEVVAK